MNSLTLLGGLVVTITNNSPDNLIVVETDENLDIDDANIRISYN